jgi:spore coat polysaccharide biosynthesis protein SpsF (cytidylyltransferase family)
VLSGLAGKSVLRHVLERCKAIEGADEVCCAVPAGGFDDDVAREAENCKARVVRGSETDVLDRYYRAAVECGAETIMRVTSDCPLIDPNVAGEVLRLAASGAADYACNNMPRSWPHGLDCEAFSFEWLERAAREALLPEEREHVTPYLRSHPLVRKLNVPGPGGEVAKNRWTLDTPEDLEFLRELFKRLPEGPAGFDYRMPLAIVAREPDLAFINLVHR